MWQQSRIRASYVIAVMQACMLALLLLMSHTPARAQSVPMPDLSVYLDACNAVEAPSERVNEIATPCVMNLLCRVVLFQSASFALAVG